MAFPQTPLPIKQEILINGVWTDITSRTRGADQVVVHRGYSGEQSNLSAGTCDFTINNRDAVFSNNNPLSPYYRQIGRNTQYRAGIDIGTVSARFLDAATAGTTTYDGSTVWCADAAALDIVGDIDIAVDVDFHDLVGRRGHILASKYLSTGNQRSWAFIVNANRQLQLLWSPDGTLASRLSAASTVQISPTGRAQYRVQLQVNNGSGQWRVQFFQGTGTDITGPYSQLGSSVFGTGVTSIFASTARIEIGTLSLGATWPSLVNPDADPFTGRFYAMSLRSSLNGTRVAFMNAYQQTAGTTSWSDGLGNTWTVTGSSYLSSTDYRFWGEIPSMPNRSDVSGKDIYIPITATDVIGRLTSGIFTKPLKSPVYRNLSRYAWDGYWPLEQESGSTTLNADSGKMGTLSLADFSGTTTAFAGTGGYLAFSDDNGYTSGYADTTSGTPTVTTHLFYIKFTNLPGSSAFANLMTFFPQGGTVAKISFYANNVGWRMILQDSALNVLVDANIGGWGSTYVPTNWTAMRLKMSASGGTITWEWGWYQINAGLLVGTSGTFSGTMSRPLYWRSDPWTGKTGMQIAHVAMGRLDVDFSSSNFVASTNAYNGEYWTDRFRRLAAEQNFPVFIEGPWKGVNSDISFIKTMGPQGLKTLIDLFKECAQVSGGDLLAPRNKFGITIRMREQEINQPAPQLDYAAGYLSGSVQPEPDTFLVENDVTLTTPSGASFRYAKTTGTLNTGDPALSGDSVGTYDVSDSISLSSATDIEQYVRRRVMFGTWDETRWPKIQVNLERATYYNNAILTAFCRKIDLLRPIQLINLTANLSYNTVDLMVVGYSETFSQFRHQLEWNTRPGGPWKTGVWGSASQPTTSLWGAASTTLASGVTSTATSLTFTTPDVFETWSTTATGYLIEIDGERMTVNSVGARSGTGPYTYAVTVTRNVNGAAHALSAGKQVTVVNVGRWN